MHRNKKDDGPTHVARPINTLTDPSTFAAPPKRRGTGLAPAPPPSNEKRSVLMAPSKYQDPRGPKVAPPPKVSHSESQLEFQRQNSGLSGGSGSGSGSPSGYQSPRAQYAEEGEEEEAPRGPYRTNTTGLSTDHLPKPPGRRDGADGRGGGPPPVPPPPSYNTALSHPQQPPSKPSLPPRLPARTNAGSPSQAPSPQQSTSSPANPLNQEAVTRLGNAGISVPGLGIESRPVASPSPPPPPRQAANGGGAGHLGELQNRFSKLNTSTSEAAAPSQGTAWAQKQAALNTASSFQKDPSSVSVADARSAAGVANNFRQRHGEQVASGVKSANSLNQKYGVANKVGGFVGGSSQQQESESPASGVSGLAGKKKPPPPPPKKKPGLGGGAAPGPAPAREDDDAPPPIPMSTRPTF